MNGAPAPRSGVPSPFRTGRAGRLRYSESILGRAARIELASRRWQRRALPLSYAGPVLATSQVVKEQSASPGRYAGAGRKRCAPAEIWYPTRDSNPENHVSETCAYADSASGACKARNPSMTRVASRLHPVSIQSRHRNASNALPLTPRKQKARSACAVRATECRSSDVSSHPRANARLPRHFQGDPTPAAGRTLAGRAAANHELSRVVSSFARSQGRAFCSVERTKSTP